MIVERRAFCLAFAAIAAVVVPPVVGGETQTPSEREAFKEQIGRIAQVLGYRDGLRIEQVAVRGGPANTAILRRTHWELKSLPQSGALSQQMHAAAMMLPEAERLERMNRIDDHVQFWGMTQRAGAAPDAKGGLAPADLPHRQHRELFYLGRAGGFSWYGFMPIYEFVFLQKKLSLDGEDFLPALVRGMAIRDFGSCTANSCSGLLGLEGARALEAIDQAIADRLPQRAQLVGAMHSSQDQAVTRWLIGLLSSADAEVAREARRTLLWSPRAEAVGLYVEWLAEGAGRQEVLQELSACRKLKAQRAAASLPKVLAAPASLYEYRQALEMSRELAGKPAMPKDMLAAEQEIQESGYGSGPKFDQAEVDRAVQAILAADDPEAAAAVAMSLATYVTKGDTRAIRKAGVEILRRLPGGEGKRLAVLLANCNRQSWRAEQVKAVVRELDGP
jgi:hypothetical protein